MTIDIVLVESPPAVCGPLSARLALEPDLRVVGESDDGPTAVQLVKTLAPDVVLLDAEVPQLEVLNAVRAIHQQSQATAVVVLTLHASAMQRLLGADPALVVGKHEGVAAMLEAIRRAAAQAPPPGEEET